MLDGGFMCSSGRLKRPLTWVERVSRGHISYDPSPQVATVEDLDNLVVAHPKNWPYTLHDVDETPFNLNHGYMWGRISGFIF